MDPVTVAWWRNLAGVLLMAEAFLIALPLLIVLFFAVRGMRALRARLEMALPLVRERVAQVEAKTHLVSRALVTPPIRIRSAARGIADGTRILVARKHP